MPNINKYKLVIFFIAIFVLGAICGGTLTPVILKSLVGNPYSISLMSERILHTHLLKDENLTAEQKEAVDLLATKYVLEFTDQRDHFIATRRSIYDNFLVDISHILTLEQYANFVERSNKIHLKYEDYNRKTRSEWSAKKHASLKENNVDSKVKFFDDQDDEEMGIYMPEEGSNEEEKNIPDIFTRYVIDRYKNNWGTYSIYEDIAEKRIEK